jgi:hypothetical protein
VNLRPLRSEAGTTYLQTVNCTEVKECESHDADASFKPDFPGSPSGLGRENGSVLKISVSSE